MEVPMTIYMPDPSMSLAERIHDAEASKYISDLAVLGYTVVPGVLMQDEIVRLRDAAQVLLGSDASVEDACGHRVWNLLRSGHVFARVVADETVDLLLDYLVGESRLLSSLHANAISPGAGRQALHTDVPFVAPPLPALPLLANTIWCLDDWAAGRGATEAVPGSHLVRSHPPCQPVTGDLTAIECEAGSVIVTNGNLWHGSGPYDQLPLTAAERVGVLALYCRAYMAPQEDYADIAAAMSGPVARRLRSRVPYPFDGTGPDERYAKAAGMALSPFA